MARLAATILRILVSTILAILVLWAASIAAVIVWANTDQARPAESIVVLGAAQYDGRPSPVLKARLDHAIDLWEKEMAQLLIVTGGKGFGDTTSEAAVGRSYARRRGVPERAILLESEGRTTRESMLAVADSLRQRGLKSAILVSDPFHMLRLWILGRRFGLETHTSPTRTSPISPNREKRWRYMLNESVKVPMTFIFERQR